MDYQKPPNTKTVQYGTAGFRGPASNGELNFVTNRTGCLAALRSGEIFNIEYAIFFGLTNSCIS